MRKQKSSARIGAVGGRIASRALILMLSLMAAHTMAQQAVPASPLDQKIVGPPSAEQAEATAALATFAQLDKYKAANAALPPLQRGRVVFFGDSITEGWSKDPAMFFPGKPYVNRGISGQTTLQMGLRFDQDVIALHPAVVVILAGTNDVAQNHGPVTPESTETNLRLMAEKARVHGISVVLSSVLPAAEFPWQKGLEPAPKIRALNLWIAAYCAQEQITYLDYYSAMAGPDGGMKPGLSMDGVHPNTQGYAVMVPLAQAAVDRAPRQR